MPTRGQPSKKAQIEELLGKAASYLPESRVRVYLNADGTIDGEIWAPLDYGVQIEDMLEAAQDVLQEERLPNTHYSTGFRFEPNEKVPDKNEYERWGGLFGWFSNYYREYATSVAVTEDVIGGRKGMRRKGYRKPVHVIIRLHWNRSGAKPPRED
jgi:hypothetical protein